MPFALANLPLKKFNPALTKLPHCCCKIEAELGKIFGILPKIIGAKAFNFKAKHLLMRFPELAKAIGQRVTQLRIEMRLSVPDFAVKCKIDIKTMYEIEAGKHNLCDYNILRICQFAKISSAVLLDGVEQLIDEKYDCRKIK